MAKTFRVYGTAADRGRQLFSCLSRFVDAGARCTKQNMELIPAELTALTSKTEVEPFLSANEHAQLKADIDKLRPGLRNVLKAMSWIAPSVYAQSNGEYSATQEMTGP